MVAKPAQYTKWVSDGAPTKIVQPPAAQLLSGWVAGEPAIAQHMNWVLHTLDQWIQYLDQVQNASGAANSSALDNARLLGGGYWSFAASTGTLTWSSAFSVSMPGIDDADNQVAAGSAVLADGAAAYIQANVPIATIGDTSTGSSQVTNITYNQGIVAGQQINGAGIPAGATVVAFGGTTATISAPATATATSTPLAFSGGTPPTVQVAAESALFPGAGTIVLARRSGATVIVGISAGEMLVRDGESKLLRTTGYSVVHTGVAGEALTAGQAVYASPGGSDGGRTQGALYKCDASLTNGSVRGQCVGVVMTSAASSAAVQVVQGGIVGGYSGLTVGATYYADPSTPGGKVATRPSVAGQYAVPLGVAVSATQILVNAGTGAEMVISGAPQGNYAVFNDTQLAAAIASSLSVGGGVIVIQAEFSIAAARVIPPGTTLLGQRGQSVLTIASGGSLALDTRAHMMDVDIASAVASGDLVKLTGNFAIVSRCRFTPTAGTTAVCVAVRASGCRLYNNAFVGCAGGTPTGINYATGTNNIDDSSLFI